MSIVKDFNELHISIRSVLLSIISIFPFYFISIFLFHHKILIAYTGKCFYINDFNILFIFFLCFTLSLTWVVSNVFLSIGISYFIEKIMNKKHDENIPFILTFFHSIFYLSIAITINYFLTKFSLINFFFLSYSILIFRFSWTFFGYLYLKIKNKIPIA